MIQQNGQPAQVVQIQRTSDDRCEIIVQPTEIQGETHYITDKSELSSHLCAMPKHVFMIWLCFCVYR